MLSRASVPAAAALARDLTATPGRPPDPRRQRRPGGGRRVRGGLAGPHRGRGRGVPPDAPVPARRAHPAQAGPRGRPGWPPGPTVTCWPGGSARSPARSATRPGRITPGRGRAARLRRHHRWEAGGVPVSVAGRTRAVAGMVRLGSRLHAPGAARTRLRGRRDRGRQPGGAGRGPARGGALHRPGQPHQQRPVPAPGLPPGGGPRGALLHARAAQVTLHP